jgi:hypothetical protein
MPLVNDGEGVEDTDVPMLDSNTLGVGAMPTATKTLHVGGDIALVDDKEIEDEPAGILLDDSADTDAC